MSGRDGARHGLTVEAPLPAGKPDIDVFPSLDRMWPKDGMGPIAAVIAQLPNPEDLPIGTLVTVHGSGRARPNAHVRWLLPKRREVHPAVRCTALLARGFKNVGAAVDAKTGERIAWGYVG
jgi:hypothetical protein